MDLPLCSEAGTALGLELSWLSLLSKEMDFLRDLNHENIDMMIYDK